MCKTVVVEKLNEMIAKNEEMIRLSADYENELDDEAKATSQLMAKEWVLNNIILRNAVLLLCPSEE